MKTRKARAAEQKQQNSARRRGEPEEIFYLCISSLAEQLLAAARSGQGRAVFGRGEAHP